MEVTEQDIAKFQEAFFTRPGDGTLTVERVKAIFASLELNVSDKEVQVSRWSSFFNGSDLGQEIDFERNIRIRRSFECDCFKICCEFSPKFTLKRFDLIE